MPLPTPNEGESRQDFVSRCMGDRAMLDEFPNQAQRSAVCYNQFDRPPHKEKPKTEAKFGPEAPYKKAPASTS